MFPSVRFIVEIFCLNHHRSVSLLLFYSCLPEKKQQKLTSFWNNKKYMNWLLREKLGLAQDRSYFQMRHNNDDKIHSEQWRKVTHHAASLICIFPSFYHLIVRCGEKQCLIYVWKRNNKEKRLITYHWQFRMAKPVDRSNFPSLFRHERIQKEHDPKRRST